MAFDTFPLLLSHLANSPHLMDIFALPQFTTSLHFILWQHVHGNLEISHRRSLIRIRICILGISFDIYHSRFRRNSFVYIPLIQHRLIPSLRSCTTTYLFRGHNLGSQIQLYCMVRSRCERRRLSERYLCIYSYRIRMQSSFSS